MPNGARGGRVAKSVVLRSDDSQSSQCAAGGQVKVAAGDEEERRPSDRFPPGHFDVITTHHVLEHLRDPADVMERLARWLKPDGVLYAAVPNVAGGGKPPHERFHFAHVHGYVRETFDLLAARAGLVPHRNYAREDTTVVYRKSEAPAPVLANPALAARLAGQLKPMAPGLYGQADQRAHQISPCGGAATKRLSPSEESSRSPGATERIAGDTSPLHSARARSR